MNRVDTAAPDGKRGGVPHATPSAPPGTASSEVKPGVEQELYRVLVFTGSAGLDEFVADWEDLSVNAIEPSPSCEWWMLLPALRHDLPGQNVQVALVFHGAAGGPNKANLCGVFPFEVVKRYGSLPATVIRFWNHIYAVSAIPLVRRGHDLACVRAFLQWSSTAGSAQTFVQWSDVPVESAFFSTLLAALSEEGLPHLFERVWSRAVFRPKHDAERYIQSIGTNHHRHEWRRHARRLAELGSLEFDALEPTAALQPWLDEFIALEMSGWKGREGTAFGCNEGHRKWLAEVAEEAHRRQRLMMLALRLDGRAIAMKLNVLGAPGSYAFKIAFDEEFLKYSPGVQLEMENIRRLHAMEAIQWMDSLAAPNHSLMNRVWIERTAMVSILAAPGRLRGRLLLSAIPLLRAIRRLFKGAHSAS